MRVGSNVADLVAGLYEIRFGTRLELASLTSTRKFQGRTIVFGPALVIGAGCPVGDIGDVGLGPDMPAPGFGAKLSKIG